MRIKPGDYIKMKGGQMEFRVTDIKGDKVKVESAEGGLTGTFSLSSIKLVHAGGK